MNAAHFWVLEVSIYQMTQICLQKGLILLLHTLHQKIKCTTTLSVLSVYLEPPSFVKKPEPFNVLSGENITFTSIVKGSPPLEVKWFRGSIELAPGHKCNITLQDSVAELELFDVQPLQSGDYTCQVSNEAGKISCTTHLFVKGLCRLPFLTLLHRNNLLVLLNLFSSYHLL